MYKRQPETAVTCATCEGNRQLLEQILADVGELKRAATDPLRISITDWRDSDTLVITSPRRMCDAEIQDIRAELEHQFPGRKAMLLDDGRQIGVLRPQDGEPE